MSAPATSKPDAHEVGQCRNGENVGSGGGTHSLDRVVGALAEELHTVGMKAMNSLPGVKIYEPEWSEMSATSKAGWEAIARHVLKPPDTKTSKNNDRP